MAASEKLGELPDDILEAVAEHVVLDALAGEVATDPFDPVVIERVVDTIQQRTKSDPARIQKFLPEVQRLMVDMVDLAEDVQKRKPKV